MKTILEHGTFEETLVDSSKPTQELAHALRRRIIELYPEVVEVPWPKQKITGYGVGPKKMSEHFCYLGAFKHHVNLGFYYGVALPDPKGILEGSGKNLRHIKVRSRDMIGSPAVKQLIQAAIQERIAALQER
jgi:hypothetical protein